MATDEEVEKQRNAVIELRAKVAEAQTGGEEHQRAIENDIALAQLVEEEARLQAELAQAKERNKVTVVRRGAQAPLGTAKEQMLAAVAHQEAVAKEIVDARPSRSQTTPTDADETNNTTDEQADNKSTAAKTQAGVKNKDEEVK